MSFSYAEFTTRNLGFVTAAEQETLKNSRVFVPGTGGMGGTAVAVLARSGVENFIISDPDVFEVSNLNRQIFSQVDRIGKSKAEAAKESLLQINPHIKVEILGRDWTDQLDTLLPRVDLVINGCDDAVATVRLMRKAKEHNKTVIDAFASTLPSVYVVRPTDPRPEETFRYPSRGVSETDLTADIAKGCARCEMEYVLANSSTLKHVVLDIAKEMITGKRSRISQAPMVWMTGLLMCYEAMKVLLNKPTLASHRGIFLNPWRLRYERPQGKLLTLFKIWLIRRFL